MNSDPQKIRITQEDIEHVTVPSVNHYTRPESRALSRPLIVALSIGAVIGLLLIIVILTRGGGSSPRNIEDHITAQLQDSFTANKQQLFEKFHPTGTANSVKVHGVTLLWKGGHPTNSQNDVEAFTATFTIYWSSPLHQNNDGYTKVRYTYDVEVERWTDFKVLETNGITNQDVADGVLNFGIGFLQEYLRSQNQ